MELSQLIYKVDPIIMPRFEDGKVEVKRSNLPKVTLLFSGRART